MSLDLYNIRKWAKMLTNRSIMHVNQDLGKIISNNQTKVTGYYNNLTEKVILQPNLLHTDSLPVYKTRQGEYVVFPVDVFQYGLGAYDLFLMTSKDVYKKKFIQCIEWAYMNQEESGGWNTFFFIYPEAPYGAMAQGEGASLLIRGYYETGDCNYLHAAQKAIDFMLKPINKGGTTQYTSSGDIFFHEYTHLPLVLNGWIFALFGLYDLSIAIKEENKYSHILSIAESTLLKTLDNFDSGYWSFYDLGKKLASPFYHRLHIAQMQALGLLTNNQAYNDFAMRLVKYQSNKLYYSYAFIKKAYQKIKE